MNGREVRIHISSLDDMGRRFVAAWHAAERGEAIVRDHVTFLSLEAFMAALTPRRLQLLRHLRAAGPMSVRRLSIDLGRDYKSVHGDARALIESGLIERLAPDRIAVQWERALTELDLAA